MKYIAVKWQHQNPDEPTLLYSELDDADWEVRKVEIFADGRIGYADHSGTSGGTRLSIEPLPTLSEIAKDAQFEPHEIGKEEFEKVWAGRAGSQRRQWNRKRGHH